MYPVDDRAEEDVQRPLNTKRSASLCEDGGIAVRDRLSTDVPVPEAVTA